jgi:hypothetical protein
MYSIFSSMRSNPPNSARSELSAILYVPGRDTYFGKTEIRILTIENGKYIQRDLRRETNVK